MVTSQIGADTEDLRGPDFREIETGCSARDKRLCLPRPSGDSVARALCVCETLGSVGLGSANKSSW